MSACAGCIRSCWTQPGTHVSLKEDCCASSRNQESMGCVAVLFLMLLLLLLGQDHLSLRLLRDRITSQACPFLSGQVQMIMPG